MNCLSFFNHFNGNSFDILQIRPIQRLGDTEYNDFDIEPLRKDYPNLINSIKENCKSNNIILLAPDKFQIRKKLIHQVLFLITRFVMFRQISFWKPDFNWKEQSFNEFSSQINWGGTLFRNIFKSKNELRNLSNRLNYEIEFQLVFFTF